LIGTLVLVRRFSRASRAGRRIHVQGEDIDVDLTAIVALDTNGVCRFVVGEVMYSDWELNRITG
jgi:hypothetical protein